MESLLQKIKAGVLWDFPGGVFPPERKTQSNRQSITPLPLMSTYWVPVKQHIGTTNAVIVNTGDPVKKGQPLTSCNDIMSVPVHAPTSGHVGQITQHVSAHASGLPELTIEIIADGKDQWCNLTPLRHFHTLDKTEIIQAIKNAGIAGLGGAAFPTHIKQSAEHPTDLLIINGIECEPYITADDTLMQQYTDEIIHGIEVLDYLLEPKLVVIAVEDNKKEALAALDKACETKSHFVVRSIPTKYPAGGEKQLIQVITNKEIPSGEKPVDHGITTQNIGTAYAIYKAIYHGEPLIDRVVTLTGERTDKPGNYWVKLGTQVKDALGHAGFDYQDDSRVIMGGPMMGFTVHSGTVPITKITNCLIAPTEQELPPSPPEQACIRCSDCADACPASLLPQQLYWHSKSGEHDKAQAYNLFDCIECGACAYVCPSDIPLVQYYRKTKAEIRLANEEKILAEKAKLRFEARNQRLEREKEARLERHKKSAEKRKQALQSDGTAKDKIAAALARTQAKKAAQSNAATTQNVPTGELKSAQPTANNATDIATDIATDSKAATKTAAQQAIERAKAKRLAKAKASNETTDTNTQTPKQPEAAQVTQAVTPKSEQQTDQKSAVKSAAQQAIARAKAKKLAQQKTNTTQSTADSESKVENGQTENAEKLETHNKTEDLASKSETKTVTPQEKPAQDHRIQTPSKADIKSKAQAAIAKAKAKKRAQSTLDSQSPIDSELSNTTTSKLNENAHVQNKTRDTKQSEGQTANTAQVTHSNTISSAKDQQADVDVHAKAKAAIQKAKARKLKSDDPQGESTELSKQDKIKLAIAKAKAKREQQ